MKINNVKFLVDASGSMSPLSRKVKELVVEQLNHFKKMAVLNDQKTTIEIVYFSTGCQQVTNFVSDASDLTKQTITNIAEQYVADGGTPLWKVLNQALLDTSAKTSSKDDIANIVMIITDGEDTEGGGLDIVNQIKLQKDNLTIAAFVPNIRGRQALEAKGVPSKNIDVWRTTNAGLEEVQTKNLAATTSFYTARSKGVRSVSNFYEIDTSKIEAKKTVQKNLDEIKPIDYMLLPVHKDSVIKDFVESWTLAPYVVGSSYYLLTKPEKIQAYKGIILQDKQSGKLYGGSNARKLLNLPDHEVKVNPANATKYNIFVNSSSTNRKLIAGTQLVVMK